MPYQDIFQFLVDIGFLDVILPFLLVFIIIFGLLQRSMVLGDIDGKPKRRLNAMIAFVLGFITVLTTSQLNVASILVGYLVLLLFAALLAAIVFGFVGAKFGKLGPFFTGIIAVIFTLAVLYALAQAGVIRQSTVNALFWPILIVGAIASTIMYILGKNPAAQSTRTAQPARPAPAEEQPQLALPPEALGSARGH